MKRFNFVILFLTCTFSKIAWSQTYISIEAAQTYQSKNDQRIPGNSGDLFSLTDFSKGPFFTNRIYIGHKWNGRHEIRGLYAPLELELDSEFNRPIQFIDGTFAANTPTKAFYKFNSYRLTYSYHLDSLNDWRWAFGATAKIRDAEVRLQQGSTTKNKTNIGFVPLAHAHGDWHFAPEWNFTVDFDGLWAPQGRAIDLGLFVGRHWENYKYKVFAGYRTVEGGADNDEVYNFSWFHFVTVGFTYQFGEGAEN